jgi:HSP20 family protein
MVIIMANSQNYSAYPGGYVPMPEIEELLQDEKNFMTQPAINLDEFDDFFKVEVSLPGIHKQDIFVFVKDNIVVIKVMHKEYEVSAGKKRIHEFDMNYFERQITLPEEADAEFTRAEYKEGILNLIIPKATENSRSHPGRIVVY